MRRMLLFALAFMALASAVQAAPLVSNNRLRVYDAVVHLKSLDDLQTLKPLYLTIAGRDGLDLRLLAATVEINYLRRAGWRVDVLGRHDRQRPNKAFHTYASALAEMHQMVADYPALASLSSVATTVGGRGVWALKISDNVATDEAEPSLLFDFSIHGDEQTGMEIGLAWIHELLDNYGSDAQITALVDDMQIFVIPMMNPDGVANDERWNGNGEDLNRSYPYWWEGSGTWSPENETGGVMDLGLAHNFVMNITGHTGAELVNYVWDSIYTLSPDNDLELWASNVYAGPTGYEVTNGAAWYIADGTNEDWYHGSLGTIAAIVELSYDGQPSNLQYYIDLNLPALRAWSELARRGVWGTVTDALTDSPLEATIIVDDRMPVYANPALGDFYRVLQQGAYDVRVWANGYGWTTLSNVSAPATGHAALNVELAPTSDDPAAVRCVLNLRKDPSDDPPNVTLPNAALGGADGDAFSLGKGGWAVFDMGANSPVPCDGSKELRVVEVTTDGADGYAVSVAEDDWRGPWLSLGSGSGPTNFAFDGVGCDTIRYVKIVDDGDGNNWIATPGADIDAIEVPDAAADDDTVDDDTIDDDTTDDDVIDDDAVDDDSIDDDVVDDDSVDDDTADDDATDDDTVDDDSADDDAVDDDLDDDEDDDVDDDVLPPDDDTSGDDDLAPSDDDDDSGACGC